jgi:uncharacterized membrane protein YkoI
MKIRLHQPPARVLVLLLAASLTAAGAIADTPPPAATQADVRALRAAVRDGRVVALEQILAYALRRVPGRVIDVEFDAEDDEYEIEILDAKGVVWELEYRASSGGFIGLERD